jgi:hypothetical protein
MIEHVDLQNPGSFGQPASQPDIRFARGRISRRVIVLCGQNDYVIHEPVGRRDGRPRRSPDRSDAAHNSLRFSLRTASLLKRVFAWFLAVDIPFPALPLR